jgi:molybdopterin synthase sulfur carrier subunit
MKVIFFGQLTDITGNAAVNVLPSNDTDQLLSGLKKQFPALSNAKFVVAVNKKQITGNTKLDADSLIVLMPPFSGG